MIRAVRMGMKRMCARRIQRRGNILNGFGGLPESQGQKLALTVLLVPYYTRRLVVNLVMGTEKPVSLCDVWICHLCVFQYPIE